MLSDWTEEQKTLFLDSQFDAQRKHYLDAYKEGQFFIIELNQQAIGRLYLYRNSKDIRVVDIGLLQDFRNLGYGTSLLAALFAEGEATNRSVSVHVEVFNPARRLYQRLGFKEVSQNGPYLLMERLPTTSESS